MKQMIVKTCTQTCCSFQLLSKQLCEVFLSIKFLTAIQKTFSQSVSPNFGMRADALPICSTQSPHQCLKHGLEKHVKSCPQLLLHYEMPEFMENTSNRLANTLPDSTDDQCLLLLGHKPICVNTISGEICSKLY